MAGRLRFALALAALLVASTLASAQPGSGRVVADGALTLEGRLVGDLGDGRLVLVDPARLELLGEAGLVNVTFLVRREVQVTSPVAPVTSYITNEASWVEARAATLALAGHEAGAYVAARGDEVSFELPSAGLRGFERRVVVNDPVTGSDAEAQRAVVVEDAVTADAPAVDATLAGAAELALWNVAFTLDGEEYRTGVEEEERAGPLPLEVVRERRWTFALVRLEGADVRLAGDGAVVAGAASYTLQGTVRAARADADFDVAGARRSARAATFALEGDVQVAPERVAVEALGLPDSGADPQVAAVVRGDVRHLTAGSFTVDEPAPAAATAAGIALLGFVGWALYTRLRQPVLLDNDVRAQIYQIVCDNPGIGSREVHRRSGRSWGTVVYHLRQLEKHNLVKSRRFGRLRNYYENHGKWGGQETKLAALKGDKTIRIAKAIVAQPGLHQDLLVATTGLPQSTVSYRIKRLREAALIEERRDARFSSYYPTDDLVRLLEVRGEGAPESDDEDDGAPAFAGVAPPAA